MHTDIDIIHCNDACVYIQYPAVVIVCTSSALSLLRLQDKVQSVAEYAPEIADQLFHDEAIFMPRADYMEPLSFVSAVETTAVDVLVGFDFSTCSDSSDCNNSVFVSQQIVCQVTICFTTCCFTIMFIIYVFARSAGLMGY